MVLRRELRRGEDEKRLVEKAIRLPDFEPKELPILLNHDVADRMVIVFFFQVNICKSQDMNSHEWMEDVLLLRIPSRENNRKPFGNSFLTSRQ